MADDTKKLGDIKVVLGNKNTVGNIGHVVNQAPPPELKQLSVNTIESNGTFITSAMVEVVAPYPPANLALTARAPSIIQFDVQAQRSGISMLGNSGKRDGFCFTNLQQPSGQYLLTITTVAPERIAIEYAFN
jgi:hypothetical protein